MKKMETREEGSQQLLKPSKLVVFSWNSFSYLLTALTQFVSSHCSETWSDRHQILVVDRPDCKPEHQGTYKAKQMVWTWSADDFKKPSDQRRRRLWNHLPVRHHELMLTHCFGEFDLDVDKNWNKWIVRIAFPETHYDETHTFHEKRDSPPPPLSPSVNCDWGQIIVQDDDDDDDNDHEEDTEK